MNLQFFLFTLMIFFPHLCFAKTQYNLSDLQALAKENNFNEFFDHALDIRPSERLENWQEMVSKMAELYSKGVLNKQKIETSDFKKIEKLFSWPHLKSDENFKQRRQEIGLTYLRACFKSNPDCWNDFNLFWEADKEDSDLAIKLAELILPIEPKKITLWAIIGPALKTPLSEFYCKKEFVQDSILGKLEIDYVRLNKKGNFLKKIDESLHYDCLNSFNKRVSELFYSPKKVEDRELAFQILDAQGKADINLTDLFYTVYLLEIPSKGDLFNLSWNRLVELSKSEERRSRTMIQLRKLDPLPDQIFASSDQNKKKAIINHFKANFPEYLDYYIDQCLSFYQGSLVFKNGNPTIKCQDLMSSDFIQKIIDQDKINKFKQVKTI